MCPIFQIPMDYFMRLISEAEAVAEKEVSAVKGPLFHRTDIGTDAVVQKRIAHMNELRARR